MKIEFYNTIIREPDIKEDTISWTPSICTIHNHESHWFAIIFHWLVFGIEITNE